MRAKGSPAAFSSRGLAKSYGRVEALRRVDLVVGDAELVGLLGPNGAGKSTLTKIACGLVRPSAGSAEIRGYPAGSRPARATLGYLAELFRFPAWMTAGEVLSFHQRLSASPGGSGERSELLELVGLREAFAVRVEEMSKGMQQRLGIAQALVGSPRVLLLDEPTSALDPVGRRIVRDLLGELKGRGVAVLLNSHLLSEVERVCDRVAIISEGRLVAEGTPADLIKPRGVEIVTGSGTRRYEDVEREDVPQLVAAAVAAGESVYGVRMLSGSLEDAYLDAVGGRTG